MPSPCHQGIDRQRLFVDYFRCSVSFVSFAIWGSCCVYYKRRSHTILYNVHSVHYYIVYWELRWQWRGQCICGLRRPSERSGGLDGYQETADGARNDCGDQDSFLRSCEIISTIILKHFILKKSLPHPTLGEKEEHILRWDVLQHFNSNKVKGQEQCLLQLKTATDDI